MSKKVVTKKKAQPPPAAPPENGAPAAAAAPASNDVRVAQQLRVLETVAGKGDADEKTYSPRTERHIKQLTGVLDFFEYSRSDIAALVRRCHFDENQIQIAVANIVEDRQNHEQKEWGTVKNKKQAKEERKLKEEEDKKEQERLEKEQEKQRREAERKAAKDARESERTKRGKGVGKNGAEPDAQGASLPPGILFAAGKQSEDHENWQGGQWWESGGDSWNNKSWEWESWREDGWGNSKGEGEDGWWGGQWEKAGSRKKGYKEKKKPTAEDDDADAALWDMPDTSVQPDGEGGLDQWTLGHLPVHERLMEGEQTSGVPKALPENALTLEELERDHLAAPSAPPVVPARPMPQSAPPVSAPMPNVAPPTTKPMIDSLPPQQDILASLGSQPNAASPSSMPAADDRSADRQDRGEKGSRGKGGKKGKGERDRDGEKERLEKLDRSDDPRRQAVEQVGEVVTVRKHSSMGCAVVSMTDIRVRQAIVAEGNECIINGIKVQIKPHTNKETKEEVMTDLFVAWGRQVEKANPLSEQQIAKYFDTKHKELTSAWKAAEEEKLRAEEQERQAQEQVLRERTEQRRRYEEQQEQLRRQQEAESQNKYKEQVEEQQRQQKWLREQWMAAQTQAGRPAGAEQYAQSGQQPQRQQAQQAQAMQWAAGGNQWMQAVYANWAVQQQQQQQQQRNLQMQGMTGQEGMDMRGYWAQYMDQRGQNAYAQASQQAVQGGYPNQQAFNYGAAAYARGERI